MCLQEAFEKGFLLEIVKHILGFWVRLLLSWKVVPFLYVNALRSFMSGKCAWEIKFIIVVKVFSVSCVSFNEMFSLHYGKCILPTYPEWNIKQAWKFNILWASSNTKLFVLLNARHREICLRYLLRSFPWLSLRKQFFMFLIYLLLGP